eukprot:TRINITY_DN5064_c0_g1_i1.p1 TRINITY_DN5064_c0_g1~~TRINITY_DN5064_c0_g1_i1.p1  ORF type:complete len:415 (-),score=79.65 TRINITY_DN5064_c0_g1_i1:124-1368(-)
MAPPRAEVFPGATVWARLSISLWLLAPQLAGPLGSAALAVSVAPRSPALAQSARAVASAAPVNPYSTVQSYGPGAAGVDTSELASSRKYLIASFPSLKQVAYCHLPDNVWRPLVIGNVAAPSAVAVDAAHGLLFVSDPSDNKVYKYKLIVRPNGLLETDGRQGVAVEGYAANWMAVNGIGDLYFTGKAVVSPPASAYDAIYRQDAAKIAFDNALTPKEIYSRSNSGSPAPKVWMPSGIAVDSFNIYWGNRESGKSHGALNKGSRQNVVSAHNAALDTLSLAQDEVRGAAVTGQAVYYLTPQGVFGLPKSQSGEVTDAMEGLVAGPPATDLNGKPFNPRSIAFDGEATAYFTDPSNGVVYELPATDLQQHNLTKFVDAPNVLGIAVLDFQQQSGACRGRSVVAILMALLAFLVIA